MNRSALDQPARGFRRWLLGKLTITAPSDPDTQVNNSHWARAALSSLSADAFDLAAMTRDCLNGKYKGLSRRSLLVAGAASLYLLNPIDLIPDFIPVLGALDDAAVIALTLKLISKDLIQYRLWCAHNAFNIHSARAPSENNLQGRF